MESPLLEHYRALESTNRMMLVAAERDDWDEVNRLEDLSRSMIARLKEVAPHFPLSRDDTREKMRIMHRIVLVDAQIRNLAQPWLPRLERLLSGHPAAQAPLSMGARA